MLNNKRLVVPRTEAAQSSVPYLRTLLIVATCFCIVMQSLFFFSLQNLVCSVIAGCSGAFCYFYVLRTSVFNKAPLSSLMVLGFSLTSNSGALIIQTVMGRDVTYNLLAPYKTFIIVGLVQLCLVLAHYAYLRSAFLRASRRFVSKRVLLPLLIFKRPSNSQLWAMGVVGIVAILLARSGQYGPDAADADAGGAGSKLMEGFVYLSLAPFLMPLLDYFYGKSEKRQSSHTLKLVMYFGILIVVGFVLNSRAIFLSSVTTLALSLLVTLCMGKIQLTKKVILRGFLIAMLSVPMISVVSDLATAMVIVRSQRTDVSGVALIGLTIDAFLDKDLLRQTREAGAVAVGSSDYSEDYISNPLLARFINTKFTDNMFYYSENYNQNDTLLLWESFVDKTLAFAPTPLLRAVGIGIDKDDLKYSTGDYMYYLSEGTGLGGYRVGSFVANTWALAGPWALLIVIFLAFTVFILQDAFVFFARSGAIIISPVMLMQTWFIVSTYFNSESLINFVGVVVRGFPQIVFSYWIVMLFVSFVLPSLQRKKAASQ